LSSLPSQAGHITLVTYSIDPGNRHFFNRYPNGSCNKYYNDLYNYRKTILEKEKSESELNNSNVKLDRKQQSKNRTQKPAAHQ